MQLSTADAAHPARAVPPVPEPGVAIVLVVAGGAVQPAPELTGARPFVVAVDGGLDAALAAGLTPAMVVGDLDSASADGLAAATAAGVPIDRHPVAKDDTDTALALDAMAAHLDGRTLVVLGGGGAERLDHVLGTLAVLGGAAASRAATVTARLGSSTIHVVHPPGPRALPIGAGRTFSVVALHGACRGVQVRGARWELDGAELSPTTSLGISNVASDAVITVSSEHGVLTVIVPEDPR
jgi:thiamine pyrophosphokinase